MREQKIKQGASGVPAPRRWARTLDCGIDDVDQGRVTHVSEVISNVEATFGEIANEQNDPVGHNG